MVKELKSLHPVASVTVTLYIPIDNPDMSSVVAPFDQEKVKLPTPPVALILIGWHLGTSREDNH